MTDTFLGLFAFCTVLIAIQAFATLPWLIALGTVTRLRNGTFWLKAVGGSVALGLVAAFFMQQNNDPQNLRRWGRAYMAALHVQLGVDLFVCVMGLLLAAWPKGAAVALAAFREGLRQPMFWLLFAAACLLMVIFPFLPYFTFGEDLKMVKELCFAIAMLFPALLGVVVASMSVHDEIEGRTAVTLMSKPISRRQFLLGKFVGIAGAALAMTVLLGWLLVWIVLFKRTWDPSIYAEQPTDPAWVPQVAEGLLSQSGSADLLQGILYWIHDAGEALPGLIIGFCKVMVLVSVAVALATRVPMALNVTACLLIYFLGHLTSVIKEASSGASSTATNLIHFMAQLFDTILPGLDLFDVGTAVVRDIPPPTGPYSVYTANVVLYGITYTAVALLFGLILFEDRDLA